MTEFKVGDRLRMKKDDWEETIKIFPFMATHQNTFVLKRIIGISLRFDIVQDNGKIEEMGWLSERFELIGRGRKMRESKSGLRLPYNKEWREAILR